MADIHKVGLLAIRGGRILLCRKKRGTPLLILPGGKKEPGESSLECLEREVREELGGVRLERIERIGVYRDRAAPPQSRTIEIELYRAELLGEPAPHNEIAGLVWFGETDGRSQLAPSIANTILPDLLARGILPWAE
jgi:8-oxo-dGTP diphosphatase